MYLALRRTVLPTALVLLAACATDSPIEPDPDPEPVTPWQLDLVDTLRFARVDDLLDPVIRIVGDQRAALDPSTIRWTVADTSVVWVTARDEMRARGNGTTLVIGAIGEGERLAADTLVATVDVAPAGMDLRVPLGGLLVGESAAPALEISDSAGSPMGPGFLPPTAVLHREIEWSSSDPGVVRVGEDGIVSGAGPGAVTIGTTWRGIHASVPLQVSTPLDFPIEKVDLPWGIANGLQAFAVGPDRMLYRLERHYRSSEIMGIDAGGAILWNRSLSADASRPTVASDGTLYFVDAGIHAFAPDGTLLWHERTCSASSSLAVGPEGRLYCAESDRMDALNSDGSVRWSVAFQSAGNPHRYPGQVVVAPDGTVYGIGREVVALTPEGRILWRFSIPGHARWLAVDGDGGLYLSMPEEDAILALGRDGVKRWRAEGLSGEIVIGPDRTLVVADWHSAALTAVHLSDGSRKWQTVNLAVSTFGSIPHVGQDGRIYVAGNCAVTVFDASTGASVGRSRERPCSHIGTAWVGDALYLGTFREMHIMTMPTEPGPGWSQPGGSARKTNTPLYHDKRGDTGKTP